MAEMPPMTVDVDVVIRSVRVTLDPPSPGVPGVMELARALATVDGQDWASVRPDRQAGYATRANEIRYLLTNGTLPITVCATAIPGAKVGDAPRPILVCSLDAGHPGAHRTSEGCLFDLKSVTT